MEQFLDESPHRSPDLHAADVAASAPEALPDARELAMFAVERTRMPMVIADARQPDQPIVMANKAFLELSGYEAQEVLGRNCRFLQGPGTAPQDVAQVRAAILEGRDCNVELLNYRKDGSSFWNQLNLSPIRDDQGRLLYWFGSQIDVTEQRRVQGLEAAEHRLLKEVDHRALNALSIVEGIVRLTRADDPARYAAAVQGRVHSLARAHNLLAANGWTGAPLERLIRLQVEPYAVQRLDAEGPHVQLAARQVQPLALVLHELAANAVMHGALSAPGGKLAVRWERTAGDGRLVLRWQEAGGPEPPQTRTPGFGATMAKAIVERQLHGELEKNWRPEGLQAELRFPLESAEA